MDSGGSPWFRGRLYPEDMDEVLQFRREAKPLAVIAERSQLFVQPTFSGL